MGGECIYQIVKRILKHQQLKSTILPQNRQKNQCNKIESLEINQNTLVGDISNQWAEGRLFDQWC